MTKSKPTPTLADPTSDAVVLAYLGADGSARNLEAPARDLTAADVARLAYVEAARLGNENGIRPDPRTPDQELAAAIVAELVATGLYTLDVAAVATGLYTLDVAAVATDPDTAAAESADTTEG